MTPSEHNGRSVTNGRFAEGNRCGAGNPHSAQVGKLRSVLLAAVTEDDMRTIVIKLVELAKAGDLNAARLLIDRTVGKKFVEQVETPATLDEEKKIRLLAINQRLRDDSANGTGGGLSVDERRNRIAEICRCAIARSGTGEQTEPLEAENDVDSDTDEVAK